MSTTNLIPCSLILCWLHEVYRISTCLGRVLLTAGLSLINLVKTLDYLRSMYDLSPNVYNRLHSRYALTHREYPPIDCNLNISFSQWRTSTSLCLLDMYEIWHEQTHTDRKREWQRVCVWEREKSSSSILHISSKELSCLLKNLCVPFVRRDEGNHPDDAWATGDSPDHYDTEAGSSVKPANPSTSLVQKTPQTIFLWALHYPSRAQYTDYTWTAPGWVGHCTQHGFQAEDCPLPSHQHMTFIIISWCYNKDLPVIL